MAAYLTFAEFKARTVLNNADVDLVNTKKADFFETCLADESAWIDARLCKRYGVPFTAPVPSAVFRWLVQIVTFKACLVLGWSPESAQDAWIKDQHDLAIAEVKEAADSETGLFDLPRRQDLTTSGITKAGPLGYSEASPYTWTTRQAEMAALEQ